MKPVTLAAGLLALGLATASAQQQSDAPSGGAPSVQSVAPVVGSGRGGTGNATLPETSDR